MKLSNIKNNHYCKVKITKYQIIRIFCCKYTIIKLAYFAYCSKIYNIINILKVELFLLNFLVKLNSSDYFY